jgi:hypothetical protein
MPLLSMLLGVSTPGSFITGADKRDERTLARPTNIITPPTSSLPRFCGLSQASFVFSCKALSAQREAAKDNEEGVIGSSTPAHALSAGWQARPGGLGFRPRAQLGVGITGR